MHSQSGSSNQNLDLHIDFRPYVSCLNMPPDAVGPCNTEVFLQQATSFASKQSQARFAVSRHFYPLMLGIDRRDDTSFTDLIGQTWRWKFIPKDMPCSEWSMHFTTGSRIKPFKHFLGTSVFVNVTCFLSREQVPTICSKKQLARHLQFKPIPGGLKSISGEASSILTYLSWKSLAKIRGWNRDALDCTVDNLCEGSRRFQVLDQHHASLTPPPREQST